MTTMDTGIKLYLPGSDEASLQDFRGVLRLASKLGYSFVMLELGGAMEYKSHPEINEGWLEYSAFMNEYPGKTIKLQHSFHWEKNSIHTENGRGGVLSQALLAELAQNCRNLGLELVPELPSLSHCDFLLTRHPELAERPEDPYPDTACPSHPGYWPLLRDILDEIIQLFHPSRINIGHDECYSIGLCPRCRDKQPHQLYADDINRTADYLRSRHVKTMIWGEKLLNAHFTNGIPCGGAASPATPERDAIPALCPCGELLAKDIQILHWYWSIDRKLEQRYAELGMDYWFGNLSPNLMPDFGKRLQAPNCKGFCISNWGRSDMDTMQRNGFLYEMVYAALALKGDIAPDDYETLDARTKETVFQLRKPQGPVLEIIHTTQTPLAFQYFFDGHYLVPSQYMMGHHVMEDEDGNSYSFPVVFGTNISNSTATTGRRPAVAELMDRYAVDQQLIETTGAAMPILGDDGQTWYKAQYPHPAPGHSLHYVRFQPSSVFVPEVKVNGHFIR